MYTIFYLDGIYILDLGNKLFIVLNEYRTITILEVSCEIIDIRLLETLKNGI
jgi:hypothetical protein